jgi:hypothetical protein
MQLELYLDELQALALFFETIAAVLGVMHLAKPEWPKKYELLIDGLIYKYGAYPDFGGHVDYPLEKSIADRTSAEHNRIFTLILTLMSIVFIAYFYTPTPWTVINIFLWLFSGTIAAFVIQTLLFLSITLLRKSIKLLGFGNELAGIGMLFLFVGIFIECIQVSYGPYRNYLILIVIVAVLIVLIIILRSRKSFKAITSEDYTRERHEIFGEGISKQEVHSDTEKSN